MPEIARIIIAYLQSQPTFLRRTSINGTPALVEASCQVLHSEHMYVSSKSAQYISNIRRDASLTHTLDEATSFLALHQSFFDAFRAPQGSITLGSSPPSRPMTNIY